MVIYGYRIMKYIVIHIICDTYRYVGDIYYMHKEEYSAKNIVFHTVNSII